MKGLPRFISDHEQQERGGRSPHVKLLPLPMNAYNTREVVFVWPTFKRLGGGYRFR